MLKWISLFPALMVCVLSAAQELKVERDKGADLSQYKTFKLGEGEIITPKDLRLVEDTTLHRWVRHAVTSELIKKGLKQVDSSADLIVSYIAGTQQRTDAGNVGPLGLTPGSNPSQTYLRDYRQGSLVIDLNDAKTNKLVWRINANNSSGIADAERSIERIVGQGFKKLSIEPKKVKKKK
jgi:hypothetical protein